MADRWRGDLQGIGQAGRIVVIGVLHAQLMRLFGHHLGEVAFGAAQGFGNHHRHVIGGADHDGADGGIDIDGLAGAQDSLVGFCTEA